MRCTLVFVGLLAACGPPSIESLCEDVAEQQCARCYSCDLDGATLCALAEGASRSDCESDMAQRCVDQAATLERPKRELDLCNDSFGELTCDLLVRSAAQNSPHSTDACTYFQ